MQVKIDSLVKYRKHYSQPLYICRSKDSQADIKKAMSAAPIHCICRLKYTDWYTYGTD